MTSINIQVHQDRHKVSYYTARNDLEALLSQRLLVKRRKGRDSVFWPATNLQQKLAGGPKMVA